MSTGQAGTGAGDAVRRVNPGISNAKDAFTTGSTLDPNAMVWIGQVRSAWPLVCDTRHVQTWSEHSDAGYFARVVLVLEHPDDSAGLIGRIAFGEGPPPVTYDDIAPDVAKEGQIWNNLGSPVNGFEYTLLDPLASSSHMTFEVAPGEVWKSVCEQGILKCSSYDSACLDGSAYQIWTYTSAGCSLDLSGRLFFDLSIDGDSAEGLVTYPGSNDFQPDPLPELRLRRVL
jgi:hypothetical protein